MHFQGWVFPSPAAGNAFTPRNRSGWGGREKGTRRDKRGERERLAVHGGRGEEGREKRAGGGRFNNSANTRVTNQTDQMGGFLAFFSSVQLVLY